MRHTALIGGRSDCARLRWAEAPPAKSRRASSDSRTPYPKEWRDVQHQHLEHTGKESGPVKYELSPEARAMLEETMAQIHGTTPAPQPGANGAATNGAAKH